MGSGTRIWGVIAWLPCVACSSSTAPATSEQKPEVPEKETGETEGDGLDIQSNPTAPCVRPAEPPTVCSPGTSIPCYEGPLGTEDVGSCKGGKRHCNAYGNAYGTCEFQVLPNPTDCTNPAAFSCDAKLRTCGVLHHAEVRPTRIKPIAFDGSTGFIFGRYTDTSLVIERWANDQSVWSASFGVTTEGPPEGLFRALAVDSLGASIVAVGLDQEGTLSTGHTVVEGPAAVLLKLDPNGDLEWVRAFAAEQIHASAIGTAGGNIWVAGSFSGEFDFGTGPLQSVGESDGFLLRLDTHGTTHWSRGLGSANHTSLFSIAVDENGSAFVGGWELAGAQCGEHSALLASFDIQGQLLWKKLLASRITTPSVGSVAIDPKGAVYVSGRIEPVGGDIAMISPPWAVDLGGGNVTGSMFVAKYDGTTGDFIWSRTASDSNTLSNMGGYVALDPSGNVMWAAQDNYAPRIRTFDPNGHQLWERLLPTVGPEPYNCTLPSHGVHGFAVQPNGRFAIVGDFLGFIDFGDGAVNNVQGRGFFAVYDL